MSALPNNPLENLADIRLPDPISWWPLAPGWWLLALVLITCCFLGYYTLKHYRTKWAYRNTALSLLKAQWQQHVTKKDQDTCLSMLTILKRCAITAYPLQTVNSLHGSRWVDFLNQQTPRPYFNKPLAALINNLQYQEHGVIEEETLSSLYIACQQWIKQHEGG